MNSKQRFRVNFILFGIIVFASVLGASLYSRQIIHGKEYASKAEKQYNKPNASGFDRGNIYFTAKDGSHIAVANVESGYTIYMNPKLLGDADSAYKAISQFLPIDKNKFMSKANDKQHTYEVLAQKVDGSSAQSINNMQITGIGTNKQSWRSYPGGGIAAQVIGIVGESNSTSTIEGKYGLEKQYEKILAKGNTQGIFAQIFSDFGLLGGGNTDRQGNIIATIEPTAETYLEKALLSIDQSWHPAEVGGIIIKPKTGEIIAMASLPSYDPNNLSAVKDNAVLGNPLIEHVYEMGSIIKPITISIGLDTGIIDSSFTYEDTGTMTLNNKTIGNWDKKARGKVNLQEVVSQSLNMGAATIALKVGRDTMVDYLSRFGLNGKTGIDLPSEAKNLTDNLKNGKDIEIATASYGQGIALSPIAVVNALSVLANGGYEIRPHIISEIDREDGKNQKIIPIKGKTILKKETTEAITRLLVYAVDHDLAKGVLKMNNWSIAAKTGTAQIPDRVNGGYYSDRYLHSFFGYFPAYDPEFLVFLYEIYPKGAQYASDTLTLPFGNIAKFLIDYYGIPPDR